MAFLFMVVISQLLCSGCMASTRNTQASVHADLGFAVDRHESIDEVSWQYMLSFTANFTAFLQIELTKSQLGLVSYDSISTTDIKLNDYTNTADLQGDVMTQRHGGYGRDISLAIFRLRADLFTLLNGDSTFFNVAVLITNGESDYDQAVREAQLFRDTGATLVSIGVGSNVNKSLLDAISGGPENVLEVNSFSELYTLALPLEQLVAKAANTAIVASPGTIRTELGMSIDFRWTLSEPFDTSYLGTYVRIYKDYPTDGILVLEYQSGVGCNTQGDAALFCIIDGTQVGFHTANILDTDASRYSVQVKNDGDPEVVDSNAVLYMYKSPTVPVISGNSPVLEHNTITLTCDASLQSLPEEFRDPATLEYTWTGVVSGSGRTITSVPLDRTHNGQTATCSAKEQGASESFKSSNTVNVAVHYAPEYVTLTANSTTVVEGQEGLELTCAVPDNGQGNPVTYTYYWTNMASGQWFSSSLSTLVISYTELNENLHDGTWQCQAANVIGNSTTAVLVITVQDGPETAFFVKIGAFLGSPTENSVITFDTVRLNTGNAYDSTTGVFTAHVPGQYSISYAVRAAYSGCSDGLDRVCAELRVNGMVEMNYCTTYDSCGGRSVILQLNAGDKVDVALRQGAPCQQLDGEVYNMFSGYLVD